MLPSPTTVPGPLSREQVPTFLTAHAAERISGVTAVTIRRNLRPDAWMENRSGEKLYPLFLAESVEAFRIQRQDCAR